MTILFIFFRLDALHEEMIIISLKSSSIEAFCPTHVFFVFDFAWPANGELQYRAFVGKPTETAGKDGKLHWPCRLKWCRSIVCLLVCLSSRGWIDAH